LKSWREGVAEERLCSARGLMGREASQHSGHQRSGMAASSPSYAADPTGSADEQVCLGNTCLVLDRRLCLGLPCEGGQWLH